MEREAASYPATRPDRIEEGALTPSATPQGPPPQAIVVPVQQPSSPTPASPQDRKSA